MLRNDVYRLENGKLSVSIEHPYESAGFIYYYKAPDNTTKIVLFESMHKKKNIPELQIGTFGKSDYGLIKADDKNSLDAFMKKAEADGQEKPLATALREAMEETDELIKSASPNNKHLEITTGAHPCWCTEKELQTIISVAPYELTQQQYEALIDRKAYREFNRAISADLRLNKEGKLEIIVDGVNIIEGNDIIKAKWRSFDRLLLQDAACSKVVFSALTCMVSDSSLLLAKKNEAAPSILQQNRNLLIAGAALAGVVALGTFAVKKGGVSLPFQADSLASKKPM